MRFSFFNKMLAVALFASVAASNSLSAQDLPLDYCNGYIATTAQGTIQGMSGNGATVSMAVEFPVEILADYAGSKVSALRIGLPEAAAYPASIELSLRAERDGQDLVTATLATVTAGWLEAPLAVPYDVTGQSGLWVVASYTQSTRLNVISFAGPTDPHACYLARDGRWTDYSARQFGSLSLGLTLTGSGVSAHDLAVSASVSGMRMARPGASLAAQGVVSNQGTSAVTDPVVQARMQGQLLGQTTVSGTLAYGQQLPFSLTLTLPDHDCQGEVEFEVSWPDGITDDVPADNTFSQPMTVDAATPYRVMAVEEGTGTWCGYCPRGIVGLATMTQRHPERFLGIAVHYNDAFTVADYGEYVYQGCRQGLPGALVNRDGQKRNPHPDSLQCYLDRWPLFAEMSVTPRLTLVADEMLLEADVRFCHDQTAVDYRVAFVLMEDSLPAVQSNYYSGGADGVMGGFEARDKYVQLALNDVARGIYPSIEGATGILPAEPRAGQTCHYELTVPVPVSVANRQRLRLAALLIDGTTGQIVQAGQNATGTPEAIVSVTQDPLPVAVARTHDLSGRPTEALTGFRILNGKITFVK